LPRNNPPILTPDAQIENPVQFLHKTHNKTSHFVTFFSIFPLFVQKVRHFVKKSTFFCHGQRPHTHFQPKIKGA